MLIYATSLFIALYKERFQNMFNQTNKIDKLNLIFTS